MFLDYFALVPARPYRAGTVLRRYCHPRHSLRNCEASRPSALRCDTCGRLGQSVYVAYLMAFPVDLGHA